MKKIQAKSSSVKVFSNDSFVDDDILSLLDRREHDDDYEEYPDYDYYDDGAS